ncbi:UNVERIFIED_CONTAM: Retrovirus-related Pol polyprotein from transposon RE2 [Sesamum radiatum]|uniref:Retrovirus-related Pol polyprotein from transposon RE2 n=1 Tax=Sesamum radiatum TaxID=300843 RepID=A0AAW2N944_SESRA
MRFAALLSSIQEPRTYSQACKNPHWVEAMEKELYALENNETWELTTLPRDKKGIGSKWVFKLKMNLDGSVERYKARLVAKGVLLAIATVKSWPLFQLDVNSAFLHGHLEEDVYMTPPEGYTKAQSGQVYKLIRSLYGLKQASRQWNLELTTKLLEFGFQQSPHDYCLIIKHSDSPFLALLVYVDDILLTGSSTTNIDAVKTYLDRLFTIKDLGPAKYFLGLPTCQEYGVYRLRTSLDLLYHELQVNLQLTIPLWCDNKVALHITANLVFHERTKHLDIDCHLVRDQFKLGFIAPSHLPGSQQIADVFTKTVSVYAFTRLIGKLGLIVSSLRGGCGNTGLSLT